MPCLRYWKAVVLLQKPFNTQWKSKSKLAVGCSKHCFEVVDRTDEVSNIHTARRYWRGLKRFSKSINRKISYTKGLKIRKTHNIRYWKALILCVLLWEYLLHFLLKLTFPHLLCSLYGRSQSAFAISFNTVTIPFLHFFWWWCHIIAIHLG